MLVGDRAIPRSDEASTALKHGVPCSPGLEKPEAQRRYLFDLPCPPPVNLDCPLMRREISYCYSKMTSLRSLVTTRYLLAYANDRYCS